MAANVSTNRAETTASGRADAGRVPAVGGSTLRRVTVVVGFMLLPVGAIILASAACCMRAAGPQRYSWWEERRC